MVRAFDFAQGKRLWIAMVVALLLTTGATAQDRVPIVVALRRRSAGRVVGVVVTAFIAWFRDRL